MFNRGLTPFLLLKEQLDKEKQDKEELKKKYETSIEELQQAKDKMEAAQKQHSEAQERLESVKAELVSVKEEFSKLSDKSESVSRVQPYNYSRSRYQQVKISDNEPNMLGYNRYRCFTTDFIMKTQTKINVSSY